MNQTAVRTGSLFFERIMVVDARDLEFMIYQLVLAQLRQFPRRVQVEHFIIPSKEALIKDFQMVRAGIEKRNFQGAG